MNSKQFESNYDTLRASMQAYLSSNNLANDFRNDTKESDPMEVDCIVTLSMAKKTKKEKKKEAKRQKGNDKDQGKDRGVDAKPDAQVKECYVCGKRKVTSHKTTFHESTMTKQLTSWKVQGWLPTQQKKCVHECKHSESRGRIDHVRHRSIRQRLLQLAWRTRY